MAAALCYGGAQLATPAARVAGGGAPGVRAGHGVSCCHTGLLLLKTCRAGHAGVATPPRVGHRPLGPPQADDLFAASDLPRAPGRPFADARRGNLRCRLGHRSDAATPVCRQQAEPASSREQGGRCRTMGGRLGTAHTVVDLTAARVRTASFHGGIATSQLALGGPSACASSGSLRQRPPDHPPAGTPVRLEVAKGATNLPPEGS